jgi:hypothetical protein
MLLAAGLEARAGALAGEELAVCSLLGVGTLAAGVGTGVAYTLPSSIRGVSGKRTVPDGLDLLLLLLLPLSWDWDVSLSCSLSANAIGGNAVCVASAKVAARLIRAFDLVINSSLKPGRNHPGLRLNP